MTSSVAQEPPTTRHVASLDGRESGDISPQSRGPTKGIRYLYYRLYTKDGPIESYNHIYSNDRSIGRILTKAVAPPHNVSSLKRYLCNIEGFPGAEDSDLYETLSSPSAIMPDSTRISLLGQWGIGSSVDDPAALVIGNKDFENRAGNRVTDVSKDLPETPDKTDTRHVYYRVYVDVGEMTSKTHFDKDDTSLGRVDVLSIAPPHKVSSLKSRLLKAEDCLGDDVQLFEDMGSDSPMDDTDVLTLLGDDYPGSTEDRPMAIVCKTRPAMKLFEDITGQVLVKEDDDPFFLTNRLTGRSESEPMTLIRHPRRSTKPASEREEHGPVMQARALHNYQASPDDPKELSFKKGDIFNIIDSSEKWWKVQAADGSTGIIPFNFVRQWPVMQARALYNHQASPDDPNELSFKIGDIFDIIDSSEKWWKVQAADGSTGIIPFNFVTAMA